MCKLLRAAARCSAPLCRDPRRLINRAPDLSLLALSWRTMAPFQRPDALWTGVCPLLLTTPDVVPLFVSSSSSSSFRPCCVLTGSSVSACQCQPSSAGCEATTGGTHPWLKRASGARNNEMFTDIHKHRGWINNCENWTLPSIFLFPPWRVCVALSFPVRPLPSTPPPLKTQLHAFLVRLHDHVCSRARASACAAVTKRPGDAECSPEYSQRRSSSPRTTKGRFKMSH